MSKCYIHPQKPASKSCIECGKPMCHNCTFQEVISSRVTAYSSIDRVVETDYGFYCPNCFIDLSKKKGYDKGSVGAITRFNGSPNKPIWAINWIMLILGFVFNFVLFGVGFVFWGLFIIFVLYLKYQGYKNYLIIIYKRRNQKEDKKKSRAKTNKISNSR